MEPRGLVLAKSDLEAALDGLPRIRDAAWRGADFNAQ